MRDFVVPCLLHFFKDKVIRNKYRTKIILYLDTFHAVVTMVRRVF